jgi:hypothetical protein
MDIIERLGGEQCQNAAPGNAAANAAAVKVADASLVVIIRKTVTAIAMELALVGA